MADQDQPLWDVFHSDRLEAERGLTAAAIQLGRTRGDLTDDDLVRPAGETRWTRLGDAPEFLDRTPVHEPDEPAVDLGDDESVLVTFEVDDAPPVPSPTILGDRQTAHPDLPEIDDPSLAFEPEVEDEAEEAADFTLARNSAETVEELDLAAMVDVAFQLVLFFLVTSLTVVYKTLDVPTPNEDKPPEAVAQGRAKSVDELEKDYILVELAADGQIRIDHQPAPSDRAALIETLRTSREKTQRKSMLLAADFATQHRNAVLVVDVANEIDLKIAIAQPTGVKTP